ncbi:hypothetical protein I8752_25110 [Nostocaceae cyanobacterium CENA369]|uniref:Uncharacterized protein n=1 Tax=Dendronalium phyllosphericum CENA369 TaxID=1725256 RepID=A0A8J7I5F6_9NOST|nr:hypothetical protein [Dendronalium phyllosphericum]MBH8576211.1 hypothetical protein [Dendronalium phyllosphericum CENA369]
MLKKQIIAPTFLLATILIAGITGCTGSNSPNVSQGDNSGTNVSENAPTTNNSKPDRQERAQNRQAVLKQIETVLTPDQTKQLEAKLQQGEKMRQALSSLNLTADQKTKIQDILKTAYPHRQRQSKNNSQ